MNDDTVHIEIGPSGQVTVSAPESELSPIAEHVSRAGLACRHEGTRLAIDASWRDALTTLASYEGGSIAGTSSADASPSSAAAEPAKSHEPVPWGDLAWFLASIAIVGAMAIYAMRLLEELTGNEAVAKLVVLAVLFAAGLIYKFLAKAFRSRSAEPSKDAPPAKPEPRGTA